MAGKNQSGGGVGGSGGSVAGGGAGMQGYVSPAKPPLLPSSFTSRVSSFFKGSGKAPAPAPAPVPAPMYPNPPAPPGSAPRSGTGNVAPPAPPTMGYPSNMPPMRPLPPQFRTGLSPAQQRAESAASLKAKYPGTSEKAARDLYSKKNNKLSNKTSDLLPENQMHNW